MSAPSGGHTLHRLSVFQCTALCVLTVSPVARQRVLEHVKGPWQSALGAVLPKSVECVSVYSTLCAHCSTCCSTACAVPSWHCALSYLLDPNCCVVLTFANRLATSQCCSLVGQQLCVVSAGAIAELADFLLPNSRGDLMRDLMPYCSWELPYLQDWDCYAISLCELARERAWFGIEVPLFPASFDLFNKKSDQSNR